LLLSERVQTNRWIISLQWWADSNGCNKDNWGIFPSMSEALWRKTEEEVKHERELVYDALGAVVVMLDS